jgi:hypothetical protein
LKTPGSEWQCITHDVSDENAANRSKSIKKIVKSMVGKESLKNRI